MRIAITGASGLVGTRTATLLRERGDEVVALVRGETFAQGTARWDPQSGEVDIDALGAVDAIVHLAGASVAAGRWSAARKLAIVDSRIPATERLCATLAAMPSRPRVLVSASAVGYYGDRGDELLDESGTAGTDFLARVAHDWEMATAAAREAGIRVVNLRIGLVLAENGGALPRMLRPFRFGLGGRLGSGRQWMSWIALDDLAAAIAFTVDQEGLRGPVLGVAPNPVTNREFTAALGAALHRPTLIPAPAFALRLLLGEMADGLLLASQRARPRVLLDAGFEFTHADIGPTLVALCR
ncbi:MAG: TIGR01777 family oxidoreductase [Planctomycetes bacterium]|nr:TIGR01777 family oxidoreductase [Planctomycetota bacterium]